MYGGRSTAAWINGLQAFLNTAEANRSPKGFMCCPCNICRNVKQYSKRETLHVHLIERGFMNNNTLVTKHGEPGVVMGDDEGEDDDDNNIPDWAHLHEAGVFENEPMDEAAEENAGEEQPLDELDQVLLDAQKDSEIATESKKFEKMLKDYKSFCTQVANRKSWVARWKCCNGRQEMVLPIRDLESY